MLFVASFMPKYCDFLVVGGGLAGIMMHFHLSKHGKCIIVDNLNLKKSSTIAGGIYNPLMLNYQKKAFNCDLLYPNLAQFYSQLEQYLNSSFLHQTPIHYLVKSNEELNDWSIFNHQNNIYFDLINHSKNEFIHEQKAELIIRNSGWVDLGKMIESYHLNLKIKGELIQEDYENLKDEVKSEKTVFCNGNYLMNNNNFSIELLKPAKGEVLIVKTNQTHSDKIYQQGVFMIPLGDGYFKVGSNFEWTDLSQTPTEKAKNEILGKWLKWYKGDYKIVDHFAGIRPSSKDRRPILGCINESKKEYIFNGLGSKGIALAPYYAEMLTMNIVKNDPISLEVDVNRFKLKK